jgi:uncharacterized protein YjbI with pentapeptide repeats
MALVALLLVVGATGSQPVQFLGAVWAQEAPPDYPWTGKTADGAIITQDELARILANHKTWLATTGKEGQRADQKGTDLTRAGLRGVNLSGASLFRVNLSGADLRESDLSGAYLFDANLSGANLRDANLKDAILFKPDLRGADLRGANLEQAGLTMADLGKANLSGANLQKAYLRADLSGANLQRANLVEANLRRSTLKDANLFGADLSGGTLKNAVLLKADLRNANLSEANLSEADLGGAYLSGTNLRGADLSGANLADASLRRANLRDTKLSGINLMGADLRGAVFEPHPNFLPVVHNIVLAQGLAELRYLKYPQSLVKLRQAFKEAGYRRQEREISCSLQRSETAREWREGGLARISAAFTYVFLDLTCRYGLSPWRPLALWALGVLVFSPFYCLALMSRRGDTGIWRVWPPDRVLREEGREEPEKLTTTTRCSPPAAGGWAKAWWHLARVWRIPVLGVYFSLVSALSLRWREPKGDTWITRLQKREYTLRPTGWVRTVAGCQSLISAFLLILWAFLFLAGLVGER